MLGAFAWATIKTQTRAVSKKWLFNHHASKNGDRIETEGNFLVVRGILNLRKH